MTVTSQPMSVLLPESLVLGPCLYASETNLNSTQPTVNGIQPTVHNIQPSKYLLENVLLGCWYIDETG